MREPLTVTGIVLAAAPSGEYDKRLTLLTRERGRITAFARGVRRTGNPMMAAANPFVFGHFVVYEGRSAYTLAKVQVTQYFTELATEFPGVYYGFYFLEFADYYAREEKTEKDMLNLLYLSCRALTNPRLDNRLIRCIFELRAMVINGEYPNVFSCAVCGLEEKLAVYSSTRGGMVCENCRTVLNREEDRIAVCDALVYAMQFVAACEMKKLFTFMLRDTVLKEFEMVMHRHVERYTDRRFKSLEVLETMLL